MKLNEIKSIIGLARSSSPPPGQDEIIESSRLQRVSGGEKFGQQIRDAFSIVKIDQISMKFVVHQWTCLRVFFVFNKCVFFVCVCVILLDLRLECVSVCLSACLSVCLYVCATARLPWLFWAPSRRPFTGPFVFSTFTVHFGSGPFSVRRWLGAVVDPLRSNVAVI